MNAALRSILVPVDFDHDSRHALRYAKGLAAATGAGLCLLHVLPLPPYGTPTARDQWWMTLASRTLAGLAERARLRPGTRTEVLAGPVAATIAGFAHREQFDLIVISGRRSADWHGSLIGPTATQILRQSRVPVLLVPGRRALRFERKSA